MDKPFLKDANYGMAWGADIGHLSASSFDVRDFVE
jgi:hypothetical protein